MFQAPLRLALSRLLSRVLEVLDDDVEFLDDLSLLLLLLLIRSAVTPALKILLKVREVSGRLKSAVKKKPFTFLLLDSYRVSGNHTMVAVVRSSCLIFEPELGWIKQLPRRLLEAPTHKILRREV